MFCPQVTWQAPPIQFLDGRILEGFSFTFYDVDTPNTTTTRFSNFTGYTWVISLYICVYYIDDPLP